MRADHRTNWKLHIALERPNQIVSAHFAVRCGENRMQERVACKQDTIVRVKKRSVTFAMAWRFQAEEFSFRCREVGSEPTKLGTTGGLRLTNKESSRN